MSKMLLRAPVVAIQLSETPREDGLREIQVLKTGNFFDPRYGKFSITRKHFSEMIDNFNKGTRGIEIALDYAHETDGEAAGWFKGLIEKPIEGGRYGLFALTETTPPGEKTFVEKTYKYVSADFDPNYKDNEEGKSHGCVLEGAALTNRPVIKGMKAVQLSEFDEGDIGMDLEQALAKIAELEAVIANHKKPEEKPPGEMQMTEQEKLDMASKDAEIAALKKTNTELSEAKVLSEKSNKFNIMLSEGTAVEAQRSAYIAGDMDSFAKLSVKVKLSETGTESGNKDADANPSADKLEDEMSEEASALANSENIKLSEAMKRVARMPKYASLVTR